MCVYVYAYLLFKVEKKLSQLTFEYDFPLFYVFPLGTSSIHKSLKHNKTHTKNKLNMLIYNINELKSMLKLFSTVC